LYPGFVVAARALLAENALPNTEAIQRGLSGNLCRCTGCSKIIQAVAEAARVTQPVGSFATQNQIDIKARHSVAANNVLKGDFPDNS
jgi:xanthine dehydrogenase iron-sulfur cluster and FAD-binding subunit A